MRSKSRRLRKPSAASPRSSSASLRKAMSPPTASPQGYHALSSSPGSDAGNMDDVYGESWSSGVPVPSTRSDLAPKRVRGSRTAVSTTPISASAEAAAATAAAEPAVSIEDFAELNDHVILADTISSFDEETITEYVEQKAEDFERLLLLHGKPQVVVKGLEYFPHLADTVFEAVDAARLGRLALMDGKIIITQLICPPHDQAVSKIGEDILVELARQQLRPLVISRGASDVKGTNNSRFQPDMSFLPRFRIIDGVAVNRPSLIIEVNWGTRLTRCLQKVKRWFHLHPRLHGVAIVALIGYPAERPTGVVAALVTRQDGLVQGVAAGEGKIAAAWQMIVKGKFGVGPQPQPPAPALEHHPATLRLPMPLLLHGLPGLAGGRDGVDAALHGIHQAGRIGDAPLTPLDASDVGRVQAALHAMERAWLQPGAINAAAADASIHVNVREVLEEAQRNAPEV